MLSASIIFSLSLGRYVCRFQVCFASIQSFCYSFAIYLPHFRAIMYGFDTKRSQLNI
ncbi:hypothetical protein BDV09DRAFT_180229 [Aspergillus tetrazonus]